MVFASKHRNGPKRCVECPRDSSPYFSQQQSEKKDVFFDRTLVKTVCQTEIGYLSRGFGIGSQLASMLCLSTAYGSPITRYYL
jgi:hypothetical protein